MTDGQGHQTEKTIDLGQRTEKSLGNGQVTEKMLGVDLPTEKSPGPGLLIERKAECDRLTAKMPENGLLTAKNQAIECQTERITEELLLWIIQTHVKELVRKEIIGITLCFLVVRLLLLGYVCTTERHSVIFKNTLYNQSTLYFHLCILYFRRIDLLSKIIL